MTEIRVNIQALKDFEKRLTDRLTAITTSGSLPGGYSPLPVGGAAEGQALSDAHAAVAYRANELLTSIRGAIQYASGATMSTIANYEGSDGQSKENNLRIAQAINHGDPVTPPGTGQTGGSST